MSKRIRFAPLGIGILLVLACPVLALAQTGETSFPYQQLIAGGLSFLMPVGIILIAIAGLPPDRAPRAGLTALLSAGLGVLAYWAVGFALQSGGIGLAQDVPSLRDLSWEWSLLDVSWGPGWGMAGLRGFFLSNGAATPHGLTLFLSHLPWVMTASALPGLALTSRRSGFAYPMSLIVGGFLYPLFGNWVWGGGWLSWLGQTRNLGHGFVDFGGSAAPFLLAGSLGLAVLLLRRSPDSRPAARAEMPSPHLPLLALVGMFLLLASLPGWLLASPQSVWAGDAFPRAINVCILGCLGGAMLSGFYTWFVARRADLFMTARGAAAGAVAALAGAPFVPVWAGWAVGAVAGLLLPLFVYFVDHILKLDDETAILSALWLPGLIGTLAPALLADGMFGAGWNGVGQGSFLGVDGLGVTGLLSQVGTVAGWEGQMYAQLAGAGAALIWGFAIPLVLGGLVKGLARLLRPGPKPESGAPNTGLL
jgi:Amt family ammonium transporter